MGRVHTSIEKGDDNDFPKIRFCYVRVWPNLG